LDLNARLTCILLLCFYWLGIRLSIPWHARHITNRKHGIDNEEWIDETWDAH